MFNLENEIFSLLNKVGVPHHLLGRKYIEKALVISFEKPYASITKELYPAIAKEFHVTTSRVERAIRHAITVAFSHTDNAFLFELFGNMTNCYTGKVTNSGFIQGLTQYLKLKQNEVNNEN